MLRHILLEDHILTHRTIPHSFRQLFWLLSSIAPSLSFPCFTAAVFWLVVSQSELPQDWRRAMCLFGCDCLKPDLLFGSITDFPVDPSRVDDTLPLQVGLIIGKLAARDDFLAVSLEAVLHIQQFLLSPSQSIPFGEASSVEALLRRVFLGVSACQSQFLPYGILNAVTLIHLSDVFAE
jgi:hypothetical protein